MGTTIKKNGTESTFDLVWGRLERFIAALMLTLLSGACIGLYRISVDVYLLQWRMAAVEKKLDLGPTPTGGPEAPLPRPPAEVARQVH